MHNSLSASDRRSSAVTSTQELESYRLAPHNTAPLQQVAPWEPSFVDAVQAKQDAMMDLIQQLVTRIETLEKELKWQSKRPGVLQPTSPTAITPRTNSPVVCRQCGKEGHSARGCAAPRCTTPQLRETSRPRCRGPGERGLIRPTRRLIMFYLLALQQRIGSSWKYLEHVHPSSWTQERL